MEEKKNFFQLLNPKQALLVGALTGVLILGTIGFVVLGVAALKGKINFAGSGAPANTLIGGNNIQGGGAAVLPPPPAVPKTDRPKVELFVMSYCPFGLQMQKGMLPAWELLRKKADIDVKFVSYAMHGDKEIEENTRQFCIQKEQTDKYAKYLTCFTASDNSAECRQAANINESKLTACMGSADSQFQISANAKDQAKWLSGRFPVYPIHQSLNEQYGVQGSPTLVINGVVAEVTRSPEAIKQAICAGFKNPPKECEKGLSALAYQPGFGTAVDSGGGGAAAPGCGT